ncbi:MAG: biopolymer transporter ExbD [Mariniblastus sp.]|nr:biopolymer transporter ExbD [Mariniblastus sp.]
MKFRKKNSSEIMEADLTPMIDVTFLLIAFFMVLINFTEVDRAEEILLPKSRLAIPPTVRPDYQVILNLDVNGVVKFGGQDFTNIDLLDSALEREKSAAQIENVQPRDISVIIRSHQDTPTGLVQKLISKCQQLGLENFSLRVKEQINN